MPRRSGLPPPKPVLAIPPLWPTAKLDPKPGPRFPPKPLLEPGPYVPAGPV